MTRHCEEGWLGLAASIRKVSEMARWVVRFFAYGPDGLIDVKPACQQSLFSETRRSALRPLSRAARSLPSIYLIPTAIGSGLRPGGVPVVAIIGSV
jgi:hypothetical protein